jgi:hypothetical protein
VLILDEVEAELAKLDKDIEDMKRKFNNSTNQNDNKTTPPKDTLNVPVEDSPEF